MKASAVKSNIKKQPLEYWMTIMGKGKFSPPLSECSPAFNIDGFYYDEKSKMCWFEYMGKAWLYDPKAFAYKQLQTSITEDKPINKKSNPSTLNEYVVPAAKMLFSELLKHYKHRRL